MLKDNQIDLDFIEIGSCDFETLYESCKDQEIGITIDAVSKYLDNLQGKTNVKKICAAITPVESGYIDVYFINSNNYIDTLEFIPENGIPIYLKGCNSVGKPHDFHTHCPQNLLTAQGFGKDYPKKMKTYNLIEMGMVTIESVKAITFAQLVKENEIRSVKKIKIDTEGQDCYLVNSILNFCEEENFNLPEIILFETNLHNDTLLVDFTCQRLEKIGYNIEGWNGKFFDRKLHDCFAILKKHYD
jgi:hypothetical protein